MNLHYISNTEAIKKFKNKSLSSLELRKEIASPDLGWTLCYPFNVLCRLSVLSIPSGLASNSVPKGVQIVGKPYEDIPIFQVGY